MLAKKISHAGFSLFSHALLALALIVLVASGSPAQNPQQPVDTRSAPPLPQAQTPTGGKGTIRSAVELVEVDVEVTDRDDKPIKGLRQDQFSVTEDGHSQRLTSFDFNDVEKIEKAPSADSEPVTIPIGAVSAPDVLRQVVRDRRLIVLFFDLSSWLASSSQVIPCCSTKDTLGK